MATRVRIPRTFELMGHTITVEYDSGLYTRENALGICHLDQCKIVLQKPTKKYPTSVIVQAFYHEMMHMVLYYAGETKLCFNERFVDQTSQLIYQAMKSSTYG